MQFKNLTFLSFIIIVLLSGCKQDKPIENTEAPVVYEEIEVIVPDLNADSAYSYIEKQVDFGPRVPNTEEHENCAAWLVSKLKTFSDTVYEQKANLKAFDGNILKSTNIIASFNPEQKKRMLLCAHWDTRPFADQDVADQEIPIAGANDGGSGVGVLLEIARLINQNPIDVGVDIILFDSEDYGQPSDSKYPYMPDSYCLGSQYWGGNNHVSNYNAQFGILLDMVGEQNATFTKEGFSRYYAATYLEKVWLTGRKLGYGSYFLHNNTNPITDDHLYINKLTGIPTIDIIQYDPNTATGFGHYWHTHKDDMDIIDKNTLKAVGQTVIQVVYEFDAGVF